MKDYVDVRREFWQASFIAIWGNGGNNGWAAKHADDALEEWDKRYKLGANGTCVPRDATDGTYNATDAGAE